MPAGLTLYTSNSLEILARQLAAVLSQPLREPLTPEIVVVQSNGMQRWLIQQIARYHGICSNVRFPFPQNFLHGLFQAAFPESPGAEVYGRDAMTWRIMKLLPQLAPDPAFDSIASYLAGERIELTVPFEHLDTAYRELLTFGADLEVLDPPDLRERIAAAAAEVAELYGIRAIR